MIPTIAEIAIKNVFKSNPDEEDDSLSSILSNMQSLSHDSLWMFISEEH